MLVTSNDELELISANYRDNDTFQVHLEHKNQAKMMVEFTRYQMVTIIQGLEHLLGENS